jgi:hypothetical protein
MALAGLILSQDRAPAALHRARARAEAPLGLGAAG